MSDPFLVELDSMIESTEEFIADDKVERWRDPENRMKDLDALNHVRNLYTEVFSRDSKFFFMP